LELPRSTAYHKNVEIKPSQEEIDIKNAIDLIHYNEPSYGVRRIKDELRKLGFTKVGKRMIRRFMREMDIVAFYPGPNLSKRDKQSKVHPYLLRNMKIERPNQVWSIDITYIGMPSGFVYMTAIIDWYSRYIVGWSISNTLHSDNVVKVVEEAIRTYGKPEILNSDQGSQFTSSVYTDFVKAQESIKISMDGKGRATDNIAIERFFRSYKWERLYLIRPETVKEVKEMTIEYMHRYNNGRIHLALSGSTPAIKYNETMSKTA
jgi:putative transposase